MPDHDRPKRPALRRTGPLRSASTVYRRSDPDARRPEPRTGGPIGSSEEVVIQAVKLGYKIADEQIAKGQEFARRLRGASSRAESNDFGDLVEHGVRLAKQVGILLVELAETTTQPQAVLRNFSRNESSRRNDGGATERDGNAPLRPPETRAPAAEDHGHAVPIEVLSSRPACVSLRLDEPLRACPDVYPLYRKDDPTHALHGVRFRAAEHGFVLSVSVQSRDPAGIYRGYAVDRVTQRPLGTIQVTVSEPEPSSPGAA